MAKKNYGIADAMRSEVKTQEPAPVKVEVQKEAKKRGRPRKVTDPKDARTAFVRTTVSPSLKKKLQIVCMSKGVSEDAYTHDLLEKAINRDYEKALLAVTAEE
ncbi:MAG: hypothetical protein E7622_01155 [Ruminococcaceae bacterium]|nr:hypothetical protein [Oscillospiraceae bacterium]